MYKWLFGGNTSRRLEDIDKWNKALNKAMPFASGKRRGSGKDVYRPFRCRGRGRGLNSYGNKFKPNFGYGSSYGSTLKNYRTFWAKVTIKSTQKNEGTGRGNRNE